LIVVVVILVAAIPVIEARVEVKVADILVDVTVVPVMVVYVSLPV
jgi:hypothetical protein